MRGKGKSKSKQKMRGAICGEEVEDPGISKSKGGNRNSEIQIEEDLGSHLWRRPLALGTLFTSSTLRDRFRADPLSSAQRRSGKGERDFENMERGKWLGEHGKGIRQRGKDIYQRFLRKPSGILKNRAVFFFLGFLHDFYFPEFSRMQYFRFFRSVLTKNL
jgi:hypothetical protein